MTKDFNLFSLNLVVAQGTAIVMTEAPSVLNLILRSHLSKNYELI